MPESLLNFPLIGARAVHFASTISLAGIVIFLLFVGEPALRLSSNREAPGAAAFRGRLSRIACFSLAISVLSGAAWLWLLAADITGSSLIRVISDGTVATLLTRTRFGHDWEARLVMAGFLAAALTRFRRETGWSLPQAVFATSLAVLFLGSLVWSGHGGATPGVRGDVHIAADMLHLVSAGAWVGGLLPLALFFSAALRTPGEDWAIIACDATMRFSTLGVASVGTLVITGLFNTWVLVGTIPRLLGTLYGRLLLLKVATFLVMLALAAFNRMYLTQRLVEANQRGQRRGVEALRQLRRHSLIEMGLGLAVLVLVGALGSISPMQGMDSW